MKAGEVELLKVKLLNRLLKHPVSGWAKIYVQFNRWEFPAIFGDMEPDWWGPAEDKIIVEKMTDVSMFIIEIIEKCIGEKQCLRESNKDRMSEGQFEYWYNIERVDFEKKLKQ